MCQSSINPSSMRANEWGVNNGACDEHSSDLDAANLAFYTLVIDKSGDIFRIPVTVFRRTASFL